MQVAKEFFGDTHLAAINYGSSSNFSDFLQTVTPYGSEYIIVTESENSVAKFKIGLGGVIAEKEVFTFPELRKLLLPAAPYLRCSKKTNRKKEPDTFALICVHNGNELQMWWHDEANQLKNQLLKRFQKNIVALVPGTIPIIVFQNGSSIFCSNFNEGKDDCLEKDETICDVRMFEKDSKGRRIDVVLIVKKKDGQKLVIVKSYKQRMLSYIQRVKEALPEKLISSSSGCHNVFMKQESNRSVSVFVVEEERLKINGTFNLPKECTILNFGISKNGNYFILLIKKKSSDGKKIFSLQIYEIDFSILLSEYTLPETLDEIKEFGIFDDYVYIASKTNLVIVSVMAKKLPLSEMIEMNLDSTKRNEIKKFEEFENDLSKIKDWLNEKIDKNEVLNECLIAETLNYVLSFYNQTSKRAFVFAIIEIIISLPFNHDSMKKALNDKNICINNYLILIDHLLKMNLFYKTNILNWFILLIDLHHMLLIAQPSDDILKRFENIQNYIDDYHKSFNQLDYLSMVIESFNKNNTEILEAITRSNGHDDGKLSNREDYRIDLLRFG